MLKKSQFFLSIVLAISLFFSSAVWAAAGPSSLLHEDVFEQPVTKGVTYEKITRFTTEGWLVIHILKTDLREKSIKVTPLLSPSGISSPQPLDVITKDAGAVAAINADFFSMEKSAFTIGPVATDGTLMSSPSRDDMAALTLFQNGKAEIGPWKWEGRITDGKNSVPVGAVNKLGINSEKVLIFTPEWGETAPVFDAANIVETVFRKNKLVETHGASTGAQIPKNGFVAVATGSGAQFLNSLKKGARITLEFSVEPELDEIKAAVGGGAVLVENGKALTAFSHNIPGRNPRTAVGISKNGRTLYMVVVEGRYNGSIGMDQAELAQFMESIGCYSALNLDGGGSSTMTVRPLGEAEPVIFNRVSGGVPRKIPEALGILQNSSSKTLKGLVIPSGDINIALNSSKQFSVLGYDTYFNPLSVKQSSVRWSVSDKIGRFNKDVFTAEKPGTGVITASANGKKTSVSVRVLKDAVRLEISPSQLTLKPGETAEFKAYVYDSDGYRAAIDPEEIKWEVPEAAGFVKNGVFIAGGSDFSGSLTAQYQGISATALVRIGTMEQLLVDFSTEKSISFTGYPEGIAGGSFETTYPETLLFSATIGKLTFEFGPKPVTQVAYMVYGNGGLALPEGSVKLSAWVDATHGKGHILKALLTDASGKEFYLTLAQNTDWQGWRKVSAPIPQDAKHPVKLRKLYIAETDINKLNSAGYIFIDRLLVEAPPLFIDMPKTEESYRGADNRLAQPEEFKKDDFKFALFGDAMLSTAPDQAKLDYLRQLKQLEADNNLKFTVLAGRLSAENDISATYISDTVLSFFEKPVYFTGRTYYSKQIENNMFIFLDTTEGGLRASDVGQWAWFKQELKNAKKSKNMFIILDRPISKFQDTMEKDLLERLLIEHAENNGVNIWVLYGGVEKFEQYAKDGVRYLGTPGFNDKEPHYVEFSIIEDEIYWSEV